MLKPQLYKLCFYTYWSSNAISSLINSTMVSSRFWTLNFTGTCWYICRFWGVQPEYWNRNNDTLILYVWQTLLLQYTHIFHLSNSTTSAPWIRAETNYKENYVTSKIIVFTKLHNIKGWNMLVRVYAQVQCTLIRIRTSAMHTHSSQPAAPSITHIISSSIQIKQFHVYFPIPFELQSLRFAMYTIFYNI